MLISTVQAAEPAAPAAASQGTDMSPIASVLQVFVPIILIFYFIVMRPQQQRIKQHETMLKALRRGDKVVTGGGIIGVIHKIEGDDIYVVEIAPDVRVRVTRDTISHVVTKTVANDNNNDDKSVAVKE